MDQKADVIGTMGGMLVFSSIMPDQEDLCVKVSLIKLRTKSNWHKNKEVLPPDEGFRYVFV
jgi:hypothetical protein